MVIDGWGERVEETCDWCRQPLPPQCWLGRFCSRAHAAAAGTSGVLRSPAAAPRTTEPLRFAAVCWWCGGTYPTTTRRSRYCNDTHSNAAAKARRKRRVRAGQARLRAGSPPCPRPDKHAYPSIDVAVAVARGMRENGLFDPHPLRAYWCVCGQAHVGRLDVDLEQRLSAPLDPVLRHERGLDQPSA